MDFSDWLSWQLADSAFPAGGFSHSAGLEAASRQGLVANGPMALAEVLVLTAQQAAVCWVPMAVAVHRQLADHLNVDRTCHAFLANHTARKASSQQGRSFLRAVMAAFERPALAAMDEQVRERILSGHFAPIFGGVCLALGMDEKRCAELWLFMDVRTQLSAAVRLGMVGPMAAQKLLAELHPVVDAAVAKGLATPLNGIRQIAPTLELAQMNQDRLYTRLFQS